MSEECPNCGSTDTNPGIMDIDTGHTYCSQDCANEHDPEPVSELQDHTEPAFPEWCIERAKEYADASGSNYWLPWIDYVASENEMLYGHPFPERDPVVVAEERRKQEVRDRQRVLEPERFTNE